MTPPETTKQKMRRMIEQAICGLFGHGRLTLSDKDGVYVDICPRCDLNYRALAAGSRRAKTAKPVECEASQSGPKGNAQGEPQ